VIRSLGGASAVVVIVTDPAAIVPMPSASVPLVKLMVPVTPLGTDAVIVTVSPKVLGPDVVTVTVGVALLTTWASTAEVEELYCAVMLCVPTDRPEVVNVATEPEISPAPITVVPSRKLTFPVLLGGTVAEKVTD
jgi:hypothetical protein